MKLLLWRLLVPFAVVYVMIGYILLGAMHLIIIAFDSCSKFVEASDPRVHKFMRELRHGKDKY